MRHRDYEKVLVAHLTKTTKGKTMNNTNKENEVLRTATASDGTITKQGEKAEKATDRENEALRKAMVGGGLTTVAVGAGSVGSVVIAGGGTSAANITTGLAKIGQLVGGGMLAGIGVCVGAPILAGFVVGAGVYALSK
jgi:hypothetical protein